MERAFELSGNVLGYVLYASQLAALSLVLLFVLLPLDGTAGVALALVFASLVIATVVGLWQRWSRSDGSTHLSRLEGVTYDPFTDPGQAAKERWEMAVRHLPDEDDDTDSDRQQCCEQLPTAWRQRRVSRRDPSTQRPDSHG